MDKDYHNEMMYQLSMGLPRKLYRENLITIEEFVQVHQLLVEKYHPFISELV